VARLSPVRVLLLAAVVGALAAGSATGGTDERWLRAAGELTMPVLAPTKTFGMTLKRVRPQHVDCGEIQEQLDAYYGAGEQHKLTILEGQPFYCGDLGDAPLLGSYRVHGRKASLYSYCQGTGCQRASYTFALLWRERGIQVVLISRGTPRRQLLQLARSMQPVGQ
jgi:hypothetical protein